MIRIVTVDDHALLREGIATLIGLQDDMTLVGEAESGDDIVPLCQALKPDIVLMDLQMPRVSGLEAIRALSGSAPAAKTIVLTTYSGDVQIARALRAGAAAFLLKSGLHRELLKAIRKVHAGERYIAEVAAQEIVGHLDDDSLTTREQAVLELVSQGCSNKVVGSRLGVSEDTVKSHMKSIFSKLRALDRAQAVMIAVRRGIIDPLG